MSAITRRDPFLNLANWQEQVNRIFENAFSGRSEASAITAWAPSVDIYETENELVLKADLPDVNERDLDVHVENNMLTIRGERKFEQKVKEENYLRIERSYGSYKNGVLTVEMPKRAEAKPKQVKVAVANGAK